MSKFFKRNELIFNAIGASAFMLASFLVACEGSSSINNETPETSESAPESSGTESKSTTPSSETVDDERDSAYCDTLTVATPPYKCNESLQIDEHYYHFSGYAYPGLGGCTFKCQHNEWSFVPAKDVPEDAKMFSDNDVVYRTEEIGMLNFKKCNAENEGIVDSLTTGSPNPKGGNARVYYRCEQENWVESPAWVACDTTGVNEGDLCRLQTSFRGIQFGSDTWECYRYAGDGSWKNVDCPAGPEKECNDENKEVKEKLVFTNDTLFYKCNGGKWVELSIENYYCATENDVFGDTCSFERFGKIKFFRYDSVDTDVGRWTAAVFDPELGFCTENDDNYWRRRYAKKGEEYYYCNVNSWLPTKFVPRQYTDSRKEGLTDEEYDMLDLPKDAKVGDRASGLLEYCEHNKTLGFDYPNVYDYCFSPNHYRYRGDGKWSRETIEDIHADDIDLDSLPCGGSTWCCTETEGMKRRANGYSFDEPEKIYQCISGETVLVERLWNRYEKKTTADQLYKCAFLWMTSPGIASRSPGLFLNLCPKNIEL